MDPYVLPAVKSLLEMDWFKQNCARSPGFYCKPQALREDIPLSLKPNLAVHEIGSGHEY